MNRKKANNLLKGYETRGRLYALAQQGAAEGDDSAFWDLANPLGEAMLGTNEWELAVRDAWHKAAMEEGYNNTFELLGIPPLPHRTFKQFQATGRDVANLQDVPEVRGQLFSDEPTAGRVYLDGGLFIERTKDGNWYLLLERSEWTSADCESLEFALYGFYCAEFKG